jgi:(E)-4-hydroxy-3-methylbut-2-enyl-diphosphate synthase
MTTTDTCDVTATLAQIRQLADAGCDIVRLAVPTNAAAEAVRDIAKKSPLPIVADIHFNYKLALTCAENGVAKLRINPGNIGKPEYVRLVADACKERGIPIRIGVNSGSLEADLLAKYGSPTAEALVESAEGHVRLLEAAGFYDTAVSMKSSDVPTTIAAYEAFSRKFDYPLHVGVTAAGYGQSGIVKAAMGIGSLLLAGIGDTIRVSLTGDPVREVETALDILRVAGLRKALGLEIISCPTCGRCKVNLEAVIAEFRNAYTDTKRNITVAIMGCEVNGPGEAREADYGLAAGPVRATLFAKGEVICKVETANAVQGLLDLIKKNIEEQ